MGEQVSVFEDISVTDVIEDGVVYTDGICRYDTDVLSWRKINMKIKI